MRQRLLHLVFPKWFQSGFDSGLSAGWSQAAFLERFNRIWPAIRRQTPFWKELSGAPAAFDSYLEFSQVLPFTSRKQIQDDPPRFWLGGHSAQTFLSTGGSTGQPLRFPMFKTELEIGRRNQIFARRRYGILPGDRCFLIWGHAAQMDSHWSSRLGEAWRSLKDSCLGYYRLSAYRLTPQILHSAFEAFCRFQPTWIYAYSSSLLSFVRANRQHSASLKGIALKACICAAEPLSTADQDEIGSFFNCPVGLEYGSVEMRVCAHTDPDLSGYYVFSNDYLLEAIPTLEPNVYDLAVTKLFLGAMPLVRYQVGDQVLLENESFSGGPLSRFDDVCGRTNDNLRLEDGSEIHSETISHAVRSESEVLAYQFHQYRGRMELRLVVNHSEIPPSVKSNILRKLTRVHSAFGSLSFLRVDDVQTTPAGKRRWVIRHEE